MSEIFFSFWNSRRDAASMPSQIVYIITAIIVPKTHRRFPSWHAEVYSRHEPPWWATKKYSLTFHTGFWIVHGKIGILWGFLVIWIHTKSFITKPRKMNIIRKKKRSKPQEVWKEGFSPTTWNKPVWHSIAATLEVLLPFPAGCKNANAHSNTYHFEQVQSKPTSH